MRFQFTYQRLQSSENIHYNTPICLVSIPCPSLFGSIILNLRLLQHYSPFTNNDSIMTHFSSCNVSPELNEDVSNSPINSDNMYNASHCNSQINSPSQQCCCTWPWYLSTSVLKDRIVSPWPSESRPWP